MSDKGLLHWFVLWGPLWPLIQAVLGHNSPLGQLVLTFDIWKKKNMRREGKILSFTSKTHMNYSLVCFSDDEPERFWCTYTQKVWIWYVHHFVKCWTCNTCCSFSILLMPYPAMKCSAENIGQKPSPHETMEKTTGTAALEFVSMIAT